MTGLSHPSRLFAVLMLATLATAVVSIGCASLQPPRIQVQRLGRPQVELTGATLDVTFNVRNPNPDPITIERVQYDLILNGVRVGDGFITQSVEVAGFGEARMSSRFDLNYLRVPGAVKSIMDRDRVDARTRGRFYMRRGGGRERRVNFSSEATLDFDRGPRP
jgi:LEA14-like dessication related protein